METNRQKVGKRGEKLAAKYLTGIGYKLIDFDLSLAGVQIDLLFLDAAKKELVVVEVKTRTSQVCGGAAHALSQKQKLRLIRAINYLAAKNPTRGTRLDIIALQGSSLIHYRNVTF